MESSQGPRGEGYGEVTFHQQSLPEYHMAESISKSRFPLQPLSAFDCIFSLTQRCYDDLRTGRWATGMTALPRKHLLHT